MQHDHDQAKLQTGLPVLLLDLDAVERFKEQLKPKYFIVSSQALNLGMARVPGRDYLERCKPALLYKPCTTVLFCGAQDLTLNIIL